MLYTAEKARSRTTLMNVKHQINGEPREHGDVNQHVDARPLGVLSEASKSGKQQEQYQNQQH